MPNTFADTGTAACVINQAFAACEMLPTTVIVLLMDKLRSRDPQFSRWAWKIHSIIRLKS